MIRSNAKYITTNLRGDGTHDPMGDEVSGVGKKGKAPSFDIGGTTTPPTPETSTPWGVTLKPVRRISKVVVVEEDEDSLRKLDGGGGLPRIRVDDEDEPPRRQSVLVQKMNSGEKVKSASTLHYLRR